MERLFTDTALATRLREAGLKRAEAMPWDTTAEQTLEIFERVVAESRRNKG